MNHKRETNGNQRHTSMGKVAKTKPVTRQVLEIKAINLDSRVRGLISGFQF